MRIVAAALLFLAGSLPLTAAAELPAKGKLLVATEEVRGEVFAQTVILLLHYDANGAMGLVINRPTDILPEEVVDDVDVLSDYGGTLFWGGPVQMNSLRALLHADPAPPGAETVVDSVHVVGIDDGLSDATADPSSLRLYIGYAGWGPKQLDGELARGSWHVVTATDGHVFDEDPHSLWERLKQPRRHLAAAASNLATGS